VKERTEIMVSCRLEMAAQSVTCCLREHITWPTSTINGGGSIRDCDRVIRFH